MAGVTGVLLQDVEHDPAEGRMWIRVVLAETPADRCDVAQRGFRNDRPRSETTSMQRGDQVCHRLLRAYPPASVRILVTPWRRNLFGGEPRWNHRFSM